MMEQEPIEGRGFIYTCTLEQEGVAFSNEVSMMIVGQNLNEQRSINLCLHLRGGGVALGIRGHGSLSMRVCSSRRRKLRQEVPSQ